MLQLADSEPLQINLSDLPPHVHLHVYRRELSLHEVSADEGKMLMAAINHLSLHVSLCEETVGTPMGETSTVLVAYV